jgi:hypothetical protein
MFVPLPHPGRRQWLVAAEEGSSALAGWRVIPAGEAMRKTTAS